MRGEEVQKPPRTICRSIIELQGPDPKRLPRKVVEEISAGILRHKKGEEGTIFC
jgi:hypothetical protein